MSKFSGQVSTFLILFSISILRSGSLSLGLILKVNINWFYRPVTQQNSNLFFLSKNKNPPSKKHIEHSENLQNRLCWIWYVNSYLWFYIFYIWKLSEFELVHRTEFKQNFWLKYISENFFPAFSFRSVFCNKCFFSSFGSILWIYN